MIDLKNLAAKIISLKEIFEEHRNYYTTNETATRDHLINPILNILGWDTTSPRFVRPNQKNPLGDIPDYTLFKNGKETLVIEAKNAAVEIRDNKVIQQLTKYSYNMGIRAGIITNGIKWLLFDTFEHEPKERIIWVADFEKTVDNYATEAALLAMLAYSEIDTLPDKVSEIKKNKLLTSFWQNNFSTKEQLTQFLAATIISQTKTTLSANEVNTFVSDKLAMLLTNSEVSIPNSQTTIPGLPIEVKTIKVKAKTKAKTNKKAVFAPKAPKTNLKITFPDGTVFFNNQASQTFLQTIDKIGAERVQKLGLVQGGIPLVDSVKRVGDSISVHATQSGFWVNVHSSTMHKIKMLNTISAAFSIALKIEQIQYSK